ncbi:NuA4-domain-containing protein [Suhomyces tanzawaensis NRRL Y-17324]|uniref:Chromatin modification-related protein EAF6 n=1 Tax=Suhomyces tanzawaensis NRRL Y-17324 TaxID=984487 RepID=A0A1E4SN65_9ASCO|nr:NuA4-domain-containing protein [Suhomyces tanzawaensis NRRL Y-17324]ODV80969.1 NuA4-domain-containing protein [Suhomyces tanzawaensis NRRL Y-17324]
MSSKDTSDAKASAASSPKVAQSGQSADDKKSRSSNGGLAELPSIDNYTKVKNQLTQQILKKQELSSKLTQLEDSIYEKESDYFNESAYGNIVKGFENFSKTSGGGSSNKKRFQYSAEDHIFSLSSVNYIKTFVKRHGISFAVNANKDDLDEYEDSVDPGSNSATKAAAYEKENSSSASTPTRKRKIRALDE